MMLHDGLDTTPLGNLLV